MNNKPVPKRPSLSKRFSILLDTYPSDEILLISEAVANLSPSEIDKLLWAAYLKQVPDAVRDAAHRLGLGV